MDTKTLLEFLKQLQPLSNDFLKAVEQEVRELSLPKFYFLVEVPRVQEYIYFINHGFAMAYRFEQGEKKVEAFWKEGQLILSSTSFLEQTPATEYIQLMVQSELLCMSYASVQKLFLEFPESQMLFNIILNRHFQHMRNRTSDFQHLGSRQRFEKLKRIFPEIEQLVPQDSVAS